MATDNGPHVHSRAKKIPGGMGSAGCQTASNYRTSWSKQPIFQTGYPDQMNDSDIGSTNVRPRSSFVETVDLPGTKHRHGRED